MELLPGVTGDLDIAGINRESRGIESLRRSELDQYVLRGTGEQREARLCDPNGRRSTAKR